MDAVIFDWETTGLPKHRAAPLHLQPKGIEFGGLRLRGGVEVARLSILLDPGEPLEPIITKITGLTDEDLRGKPTFEDVLPQLAEFFSGADLALAHNLPFDREILRLELARLGFTLADFPWPKIEVCTVQLNAAAWGRRPKLTELYEHAMGTPLAQTHRATDDCAALAAIVLKEKWLELFTPASLSIRDDVQKDIRPGRKSRRPAS